VKVVPTSFTTDESTASAVSNDGSVVTFNIQRSGSTDIGRLVDFASVTSINGPNISYTSLFTRGVSKDGATIVGDVDGAPFKTVGNGGQVLSLSPFVTENPPSASAYDVSSDGTAIVGNVFSGTYYAFYCKGGSCREASFLDTANHEITTTATSVSADGSVVAGYGSPVDSVYTGRAWRWTPSDGKSTSLQLLAGTWQLPEARSISGDGKVIVGSVLINAVSHAIRWTGTSGTATDLGLGVALGTNSDGTVIVGADNSGAAIVWSGSTGSTPTRKTLASILGTNPDLSGATLIEAVAVSDDGKVVAATATIGGKKRALMAHLP
jgi:uncharacterized membrane protein